METLNKPNFLVVGTPKGGTSSLYRYLKVHPEIYLPEQKELHFFSCAELYKNINGPGDKIALINVIQSWGEYLTLYKNITTEKAAGDVSPSYLYYSKESILKINGLLDSNLKIIIMLRDPIERAFSNFLHQKRLMHEKLDFNEVIKIEEERIEKGYGDFWRYLGHSLYSENCMDYINAFGSTNVKIVLFEDFVSQPHETIKSIFEFLEVDGNFTPNNLNTIYNKGGVYTSNVLTKFLLKPTVMKEEIKRLVGNKIREQYKMYKNKILLKNRKEKPAISEESIKYLQSYFFDDVKKLKEMGLDITLWKYF